MTVPFWNAYLPAWTYRIRHSLPQKLMQSWQEEKMKFSTDHFYIAAITARQWLSNTRNPGRYHFNGNRRM